MRSMGYRMRSYSFSLDFSRLSETWEASALPLSYTRNRPVLPRDFNSAAKSVLQRSYRAVLKSFRFVFEAICKSFAFGGAI